MKTELPVVGDGEGGGKCVPARDLSGYNYSSGRIDASITEIDT